MAVIKPKSFRLSSRTIAMLESIKHCLNLEKVTDTTAVSVAIDYLYKSDLVKNANKAFQEEFINYIHEFHPEDAQVLTDIFNMIMDMVEIVATMNGTLLADEFYMLIEVAVNGKMVGTTTTIINEDDSIDVDVEHINGPYKDIEVRLVEKINTRMNIDKKKAYELLENLSTVWITVNQF